MEKVVMKTSYVNGNYGCCCDLLPGWTVTHKGDFEKFKAYVQESIDFYLNCARKDGDEYPTLFDEEYEIVYDLDTCALLNYLQGTLTFSGLQTITGINQKQLAHYAAGRSVPRAKQALKIKEGLRSYADTLRAVAVY